MKKKWLVDGCHSACRCFYYLPFRNLLFPETPGCNSACNSLSVHSIGMTSQFVNVQILRLKGDRMRRQVSLSHPYIYRPDPRSQTCSIFEPACAPKLSKFSVGLPQLQLDILITAGNSLTMRRVLPSVRNSFPACKQFGCYIKIPLQKCCAYASLIDLLIINPFT